MSGRQFRRIHLKELVDVGRIKPAQAHRDRIADR